jgi:hypothetical protein
LAPLLMFLRYAAGDHAWHSNGRYANLTVDDAWLREPYGNLRYADLLEEMQRHNFHTSMAFVPWNFDRSESEVVRLFLEHPGRYSICVHGNNHDHQEFGSLRERSLEVQEGNLRQAIARMEKFKSLTQIPYDRVMVFPHRIAPAETLGSLKRYNFLATANSRDIPLDSSPPPDSAFALRPITVAFANFPSLRRYSAEIPIPKSDLAIDAFVGNPMLFYVHQAYFAESISRFDPVADAVNELQPDTLWRGLGDIAEHFYLERLRTDGNYDVRAFTNSLQLSNVHPKDAIFFIEKEEDFRFPLILLVGGQPHLYSRAGNRLRFEVPIHAGMTAQITIHYQDDLDLSAVDTSKSSLRIAGLRYLSDFRDNFISRTAAGRRLIEMYTSHETRLKTIIGILLSSMLLAALASTGLAWKRRRVRTSGVPQLGRRTVEVGVVPSSPKAASHTRE